jgi:phosphonate transport system permease protein
MEDQTVRIKPWVSALLSVILPGLGQMFQKNFKRGLAIFALTLTALVTAIWYGKVGWYVIPALIWIWGVFDAYRFPKISMIGIPVVLWLVLAYGIGWQATEIDPLALITNTDRARLILAPMLRPDFTTPRTEKISGLVKVQLPCSTNPPLADRTTNGIHLKLDKNCVNLNEFVTVSGEGLWPNYPVTMNWYSPIGAMSLTEEGMTDETGKVTIMFQVQPIVNIAAPDQKLPQLHEIALTQTKALGGIKISEAGAFILKGIYETLALALLSTVIGAIIAIPFGFLAARNLMTGNPVTGAIYVSIRTLLNVLRSIESLIMAIIFVVIVGLGPFPGFLAITVHTVAALGKLYSEVIEGIELGPIEAIRSTGATWLQVIRYAVVPQIVPPFTALTIYRWDINVRSSTIIGFVGGGGIGFYLYQWILLQNFRAVSASFIAIAIVVMVLDYFSARLREQIK